MSRKQHQAFDYGNTECPVCHGTNWYLYKATVYDYGWPEELEYAKKCPKCSGRQRMNDRTGVPDDYYEADLYKFDFEAYTCDLSNMKKLIWNMFNDFDKWRDNGKGLYLWSKTPGSGKTFLSCCIAKSIMLKYDIQMRFVTAPDYINLVGDSYKRERGEADQSKIYRECPLLVFDDIGTQIDKDWQRQEIFRLINSRMENGGVTIYTSNMSAENLNVDDRSKDRIIKTSVVLQMPEESIRRKKAKNEQADFLRGIL